MQMCWEAHLHDALDGLLHEQDGDEHAEQLPGEPRKLGDVLAQTCNLATVRYRYARYRCIQDYSVKHRQKQPSTTTTVL